MTESDAAKRTTRKGGLLVVSGPSGSGKTTIGKRLAAHLDLDFHDCDRELESQTGASVNLIFDVEGEVEVFVVADSTELRKWSRSIAPGKTKVRLAFRPAPSHLIKFSVKGDAWRCHRNDFIGFGDCLLGMSIPGRGLGRRLARRGPGRFRRAAERQQDDHK